MSGAFISFFLGEPPVKNLNPLESLRKDPAAYTLVKDLEEIANAFVCQNVIEDVDMAGNLSYSKERLRSAVKEISLERIEQLIENVLEFMQKLITVLDEAYDHSRMELGRNNQGILSFLSQGFLDFSLVILDELSKTVLKDHPKKLEKLIKDFQEMRRDTSLDLNYFNRQEDNENFYRKLNLVRISDDIKPSN